MTTTATLDPRTRAALEQRSGRDLLSYTTGDVAGRESLAAKATRARAELAKGGPAVLTDVDVLKVGSFNYGSVVLDEIDLEAMVARFAQLRDSGVFAHVPVRLDHSWSILAVCGYVDDLRTREGVDLTTGEATTFLVADLRITEPDPVLGMIERGTIVNRSSEVGEYLTNAGRLYPLAYWGLAFVDIPAVEGLSPLAKLSTDARPHSIKALTADPKGSTVDTDQQQPDADSTEEGDERQQDGATDQLEGAQTGDDALDGADEQGAPGENGEPGGEDEPDDVETPDAEVGAAREGDDGEGGASGDSTAEAAANRAGLTADERAELEALRAERVNATVALMRERGVLKATDDPTAVSGLLSRMTAADRGILEGLLRNVTPPRSLGSRRGATTSTRPGGAPVGTGTGAETDSDFVAALSSDTPPDEVGALWANLTTAQRKPGSPEHAAYTAWRLEQSPSGR